MAVSLTPADSKLLLHVWQSFEGAPKVDTKKLAELGPYKTAASANACWHALRKKLMPKPDGDGKTTEVKLTEKDGVLLGKAWASMTEVPKVDSKKLAELSGYKTAASANACWHALRKKLFAGKEDTDESEGAKSKATTESTGTPTTKSKKRKAAVRGEVPDSDVEDAAEATAPPATKETATPKKRKTNKKAIKDEVTDNEEETASMPTPPAAPTKKKGGRKPKTAATTTTESPAIIGTTMEGAAGEKSDASADDSVVHLLKTAAADEESESAAASTVGDEKDETGAEGVKAEDGSKRGQDEASDGQGEAQDGQNAEQEAVRLEEA